MWVKTSTKARFAAFVAQTANTVELAEMRTLGLPAMTSSVLSARSAPSENLGRTPGQLQTGWGVCSVELQAVLLLGELAAWLELF